MKDLQHTILSLILIVGVILSVVAWPLNAYRLTQCDFKAPLKGEFVHTFGLFTPTYLFTAWSNWDK